MVMHKVYLMSIFFVLVSINTYSQNELTLDQAWEKAYQDYPELKEKNALINAAQFNTLKVKSGTLFG